MNIAATRAAYQTGQITKAEYISQMHRLHALLFEYADYLRDTDITSIEIQPGQVVMTARASGIRLLCDSANKRIAPLEILNFGRYEAQDAELLMRLARPTMNVFDVGANIGWYALNFARCAPSIQVYAFEPVLETYRMLVRNTQLNLASNVHPFHLGLSNQTGTVTFYIPPGGADNASAANLSGRDDVLQQQCPVTTLDEFVRQQGLRVDLLKCDVEGAELFVLQGGRTVIPRDRPVIFVEMLRKWCAPFHYHPNEILQLLREFGYRCFTANGPGAKEFEQMDDSTVETNFFFLHPDQHAQQMRELIQ